MTYKVNFDIETLKRAEDNLIGEAKLTMVFVHGFRLVASYYLDEGIWEFSMRYSLPELETCQENFIFDFTELANQAFRRR